MRLRAWGNLLTVLIWFELAACGGRSPATAAGDAGGAEDAADDALGQRGDAAAPQDAAPVDSPTAPQDAGGTPSSVACGSGSCALSAQECCIGATGASCVASGAQCVGVPVTCDGPEDCTGGTPVCCIVLTGANRGVQCAASGGCQGERLCRVDGDCPAGATCCGSDTLGGNPYRWCRATALCPSTSPTQGVPCGTASCNPPDVCCARLTARDAGAAGAQCEAQSSCQGTALACDGPEDCSGGTPACCGHLVADRDAGVAAGTECVAAGGCSGGALTSGIVCHSDADCPTGTCQGLPIPGLNLQLCR